MEHFFLVADWGSQNYLEVPNIMFSAGSIAGPDGTKWNYGRTKLPEGYPERLILDSGGFSMFQKWGDYPFTPEAYCELAHHLESKYPLYKVVTLDYPCEEKVNRTVLSTNKERIHMTVNNAVMLYDEEPSLPWLPVIQGYTLEEYLFCIDLYKESGIKSDYWAIGSICSRKGNHLTIRHLITKIKEQISGKKIHTFGLSLSYLADPQIFSAVYSSDSAAWLYGYDWSDKSQPIRTLKRKIALNYHNRMESLIDAHRGQMKLE